MKLWKPQDAADYLGLSVLTVTDWARAGKIPAQKIGYRWRFIPEVIKQWVEENDATKKEPVSVRLAGKAQAYPGA